MFVGKARSLPKSEASEKYFNRVDSGLTVNIRLGFKGLPGANTLACYKHSLIKFYDNVRRPQA